MRSFAQVAGVVRQVTERGLAVVTDDGEPVFIHTRTPLELRAGERVLIATDVGSTIGDIERPVGVRVLDRDLAPSEMLLD